MHNSTLEYASTASILKPFERKFLKKWFSTQIWSKPPSPQEMEQKNGEEKENLQESLQIKGKLTFERRKTLQLPKSYWMWSHFLPLHHSISKTLSKIIEKVFLTLFGPSFSLAIYMTWVVPFSFTHELHIFNRPRQGENSTKSSMRWVGAARYDLINPCGKSKHGSTLVLYQISCIASGWALLEDEQKFKLGGCVGA
jgi:hypothetical protein